MILNDWLNFLNTKCFFNSTVGLGQTDGQTDGQTATPNRQTDVPTDRHYQQQTDKSLPKDPQTL